MGFWSWRKFRVEDGSSAIRAPKKWPGTQAPFSHVHPSTSTVTMSLVRSGRILFMIAFMFSTSRVPSTFRISLNNFETLFGTALSSNSHNSSHAIPPMTFQVPIHCFILEALPGALPTRWPLIAFLHFMLSILSSSPSCPNFPHFMRSNSSFRVSFQVVHFMLSILLSSSPSYPNSLHFMRSILLSSSHSPRPLGPPPREFYAPGLGLQPPNPPISGHSSSSPLSRCPRCSLCISGPFWPFPFVNCSSCSHDTSGWTPVRLGLSGLKRGASWLSCCAL